MHLERGVFDLRRNSSSCYQGQSFPVVGSWPQLLRPFLTAGNAWGERVLPSAQW